MLSYKPSILVPFSGGKISKLNRVFLWQLGCDQLLSCHVFNKGESHLVASSRVMFRRLA